MVSKEAGRSRVYSFNPKSPFNKPIRELIEIAYEAIPIKERQQLFETRRRPRRKVEGQILYLYSPTDCIRDRLASYIHFKERECLDQAALVAQKLPFNKKKVKDWCNDEGSPEAYDELLKKLKRKL